MCDGLEEQSQRPDFLVAMVTYGAASRTKDVCYGCAATCALQKLAGVDFRPDTIDELSRYRVVRNSASGVIPTLEDLVAFEGTMDRARCGSLGPLWDFLEIIRPDDAFADLDDCWYLTDSTWREQLPMVRAAIARLEEHGY